MFSEKPPISIECAKVTRVPIQFHVNRVIIQVVSVRPSVYTAVFQCFTSRASEIAVTVVVVVVITKLRGCLETPRENPEGRAFSIQPTLTRIFSIVGSDRSFDRSIPVAIVEELNCEVRRYRLRIYL